jgi:hypothetical protein
VRELTLFQIEAILLGSEGARKRSNWRQATPEARELMRAFEGVE